MDIRVASERAFQVAPQISLEVARDRLEQKKTSYVAGPVGSLISRIRSEEIQLVSVEMRLEPFWLVDVYARTAYDRPRTLTVPVSGPNVQRVTTLGQDVPVTSNTQGESSISFDAVEHWVEEQRRTYTFDGAGAKTDLCKYLPCAKSEITDFSHYAPEQAVVVLPQAQATTVVRAVLSEVIRPVQAQLITEERVDLEALDLYFHPVYAFEYEWAVKAKRVVVALDAITGETHSGAKRSGEPMRSLVTRDLIFDVTADAVGMFVPGGSIAVRVVKAVVDRNR